MSSQGGIWLGADPGGTGAFGVAVVQGASVTSNVVSSADEAVGFYSSVLGRARPSAVGIDAPLWWSSGRSGGRKVDGLLRRTYGLSGGEVQAPNSLRGAALIQAAMLIVRLRERFSTLPVTETHPKALLNGVFDGGFHRFAEAFALTEEPAAEHARDAVVGAVAAREAFCVPSRWAHDLSLDRHPEEQDPKSYWLAPVSYAWPEAL